MSSSQNDQLLTPRKRSADDLTDPDQFLEVYFEERGIDGDLTSDITRSIDKRAENARERFKRIRTTTGSPGEPASFDTKNEMLTPEQKYKRRLVNNRKSSAASRVHREVLKAERAFALSQLVKKTKEYEQKVLDLKHKLSNSEAKVVQLQAENENLRMNIQGQRQHNHNHQHQDIISPSPSPAPLPSIRKPPRVVHGTGILRNSHSRRPASGLSSLNTNLAPTSHASLPLPTPPAYNMVPLTPKTANRAITAALKLEDSVVKGVMGLDNDNNKQAAVSLEQSSGVDVVPFPQDFDAPKCGDSSPNSRQDKALFCF